jgi:CheY-like chemotaxis protein
MEFDPVLIEHFARIRASTETALAAIGDLVDFSNVSGGVVLNTSAFGLRAALADLVKRVASEAEERGCRLRVRVEQDVSDHLEGDVERLQMLLKNLLDNAFQLAPGAEIALHITPEYVTESGIQLSFGVSATMDGGEKPVPRFSPESGMGVAVAKFMVIAMGGKLAISSRPGGEIYSFTIEFPVLAPVAAPRRPTHASIVGLSVLIVSADAEQRLGLSNTLRGWRMVPLEADNPEMALKLLERMHEENVPVPLVIVSDRLPVQDGFMLAFRVKHHRKLGATILMMLAARGKPGDAIACRENGISAYMRYPIGEHQLNEAVKAVTGASVDLDETPTLVTRHSLREQRKGATILLVDANRDSQILASHILSKRDCNVSAAQDLAEALAALEQDFYDLVLVDPGVGGLQEGPAKLRAAITRDADKVHFVACSVEHSPAWSAARKAEGYDSTLGKPFNKDHLLATLAALGKMPEEA